MADSDSTPTDTDADAPAAAFGQDDGVSTIPAVSEDSSVPVDELGTEDEEHGSLERWDSVKPPLPSVPSQPVGWLVMRLSRTYVRPLRLSGMLPASLFMGLVALYPSLALKMLRKL